MSLSIVKKFSFCSAHRLPKHKGGCQRIHGHNYKLEVGVSGHVNNETGMIADFKQLKDLVNEMIIEPLDHYYLNELCELEAFPIANPTAENMVLWMVATLSTPLVKTGCSLSFIRLYETDTSYAEWRK